MEEFPSNSQRAARPRPERTAAPKREKVERVVTSTVQQRKKPLGKRFMETFGGGDAKGTASYVVAHILVPAAKDMLADAVTQGFERMIFGESRSGSRRPGRSSGPAGYVAYNRMAATRGHSRDREETREISRRARSTHEFDEIILDNRVEAEHVLEKLEEIIAQYGECTVSDLYDLVGVTSKHTDGKWGWSDLQDARVEFLRGGGYLLDLPRTAPIE